MIYVVLLSMMHIIGCKSYVNGVKLNKQSINIDINSRYATMVYSFSFRNNKDYPVELDYELTIDPNAYISHFIAEIDGIKYKGITKSKTKAKREYNRAKKENKNTILLSQDHDANQFSIKTALKPKSTAILNVTIEQLMLKIFAFYELSLDLSKMQRDKDTDINIKLNDGVGIEEIDIPFGEFKVIEQSLNHKVLTAKISESNHDKSSYFILRYKNNKEDGEHNEMLFDPKTSTFLHTFSDNNNKHQIIPRRVVFILDKSGSMWNIWKQAQESIIGAISNLQIEIDRFGLVLFSSDIEYKDIEIADNAKTINEAVNFIQNTEPGGATNLYESLKKAMKMIENDMNKDKEEPFINQIILVTDGQPNVGIVDDKDILNKVKEMNDRLNSKISIFGIAISEENIGNSWVKNVNYPLIRSLSIENGGFDKRVKQYETKQDLQKYYKLLQSPQLRDIEINYGSSPHKIGQLTDSKFNTLYKGTDIIIAGKIKENEDSDDNTEKNEIGINTDLFAKSAFNDIKISKTFVFNSNKDNMDDIDIERIWAFLKLKQCEQLLIKNKYLSVPITEMINENALELALKFNFVTKWSSMIVIDDKPKSHKMIDTHSTNNNNKLCSEGVDWIDTTSDPEEIEDDNYRSWITTDDGFSHELISKALGVAEIEDDNTESWSDGQRISLPQRKNVINDIANSLWSLCKSSTDSMYKKSNVIILFIIQLFVIYCCV